MKKKIKLGILLVVVVAILGFAGYFGYLKIADYESNHKTRQAVFLTNGQVYFGYLSSADKPIATLKDVYYLKADTNLQSGDKPSNGTISLVKLGKELHSPEDIMYISHDQILFYEDMKSASKINDAIQKYLSSGQTASN